MKMQIITDMHGCLCNIPECDLLILGGDICPDSHSLLQAKWLDVAFRDWLDQVPAKQVVGVAGNHDLIFERSPHLVPPGLRWNYLEGSGFEFEGFKIWGLPWIMPIWGAFQKDEGDLKKKYAQIPENIDIVISHGPPFGIGDYARSRSGEGGENCGSVEFLSRLYQVKPQLVVFGHIHEGRGLYEKEGIIFINAAMMDAHYSPVGYPFSFELKSPK
jgi:Icc-related predicted phosphoesterase